MENKDSERRTYSRIDISFPVECNILPKRNYFYTVSKDLSSAGVKILSNDFLSKGNFLKVNINLIDNVINLKAKVAWCNKERVCERYSAGLEFIEINEKDRVMLSDFLNKINR